MPETTSTIAEAQSIDIQPWEAWEFVTPSHVSYTPLLSDGSAGVEGTVSQYAVFTIEDVADHGFTGWVSDEGDRFYAFLAVDSTEPIRLTSTI